MKIKTLFIALMIASSCWFGTVNAADAAPATAPAAAEQVAAAPAKKAQPQSYWKGMLVPILIVVVMIFLFSRANKKQQRQRQEMMDKIVKGSKVLLNSGVYGKVIEVKEKEFLVEIAENVRVLVIKEGIARIEEEQKEESK